MRGDAEERAKAARETAVRVVRRMSVDRKVSPEEMGHLARAVGDLATIVLELVRRPA